MQVDKSSPCPPIGPSTNRFALLTDNSSSVSAGPSPQSESMEIKVLYEKTNDSDASGSSKKSLKRRANKEASDASVNKMKTPSPPLDGTLSSPPVKYQHNDIPPFVVHFRHASDIPGERINTLKSRLT